MELKLVSSLKSFVMETNWVSSLFQREVEILISFSGPLHMSPVDRAGSVSEISPRHSILYKNSMCSYEKAGWPGYRDLGNRSGNFSHMKTPARIPKRKLGVTPHSSEIIKLQFGKKNIHFYVF